MISSGVSSGPEAPVMPWPSSETTSKQFFASLADSAESSSEIDASAAQSDRSKAEEEMKTAGAGQQQVVVDNFSFAPATTAVPVGSTITWTNRDDVPHNIVSTERKFKSPVLDTDEKFSHTFDAPGTYKYYCSIHPKMIGEVVVA